jgi:hypothetical protein
MHKGRTPENERKLFFFLVNTAEKKKAAISIRYNGRQSKSKAHRIETICCQVTRENNDGF